MQIQGNVFVVTGGRIGAGGGHRRHAGRAAAGRWCWPTSMRLPVRGRGPAGSQACFVQTDVTSEDSARNALAVATGLGTLRGLVNCAGIGPAEKVVGREGPHRLESFVRTLQINLVGSFNMIRLAAQIMSASQPDPTGERGVLVNTASVAAFDGQIGQAAYAASKGGVVAMTLPIARELSRSGIRVMTIAPGIMETPMLLGLPAEVQDSLGKMVPFPPRLGRPAEFAALVEHIFSNQYLNGEVIRLDGGIRMAAK